MDAKYRVGDVVRFRNPLYSAFDRELFLIERVYALDGELGYGGRTLIPVKRFKALVAAGRVNDQVPFSSMYVHEHELSEE